MKRQKKKKGRGILNKILIILFLFVALFTLMGYQKDFNNDFDLLIKRHSQQQERIRQLESENERLRNSVVYQHEQIQQIKIDEATVEMKPVISEQPATKTNNNEVHNERPEMDVPTILVGALATMGGLVKTLLPSIP